MKKQIKYIVTAVILFMSLNLNAQNVYYGYGTQRAGTPRLINWTPETTEGQRWTIALRPIYLAQHGLRMDFEFELAKPGDWVRIELAYHNRRTYTPNNRYYNSYYNGWSGITSAWDDYIKMNGAGIGVGFKSMWSPGGWYYNAQATFNFYNVWHNEYAYRSAIDEDGFNIWTGSWGHERTRFYKPEISFNIGKHFAIGTSIFVDGYIGLGYAWNFSEGFKTYRFSDNPYAFGGQGLFFNTGLRIGLLFGK